MIFLTEDEVVQLTGRIQPTAQVRALRSLGVLHKQNAAGHVLVHTKEVERLLVTGNHNKAVKMPNLEALDGATKKNA